MAIEFTGRQASNSANAGISQAGHELASITVDAGDLVVVTVPVRDGDVAISSVVGSVNGAYTIAGAQQYNVTQIARAAIYYFENSGSGSETITVTMASAARAHAVASTWTGARTSGALDQNNGANTTADSATHTCGEITTTGAGLIVTAIETGVLTSFTQTGFTALTPALTRDRHGYRITTGVETNDGDFTTDPITVGAHKIASFLAAGGQASPALMGQAVF